MAELLAPCAVAPSSVIPVPNVNGVSTFMGGATTAWTGEVVDVESPIFSEETGKKVIIGQLAQRLKRAAAVLPQLRDDWSRAVARYRPSL